MTWTWTQRSGGLATVQFDRIESTSRDAGARTGNLDTETKKEDIIIVWLLPCLDPYLAVDWQVGGISPGPLTAF